MGPGIVIPVVIVLVIVPITLWWAKQRLRNANDAVGEAATSAGSRFTSRALRTLPTPPWRVVHEIAPDRLGGIEHVVIGPGGVFAVTTVMQPLPDGPDVDPDPAAIAREAIARGELDDALRRCAMSADATVRIHWGPPQDAARPSVDVLPGLVAVDGRSLLDWAGALPERLSPAQVDLAWQTVVTAIGRPDPLR